MTTPFEITREEVLELAAKKLVDAYGGEPDMAERAEEIIRAKVGDMFSGTALRTRIDDCLTAELERLLGTEIVPVDIWGQREGKPTTVRAQLAERAKLFWEVNVNEDGKECSWGGTKRCEILMKKLLREEFEKAVKNNAEVIVSEFKKAITADATKMVTENIDRLIKTR